MIEGPMSQLLALGTGDGAVTVMHPCHRSPGGEWDALAALPRRELRILTGARVLTPWGLPPDVAALEVGARLNRPELTPDDLADFLRRVAVPAIAERRTIRQRRARQRSARANGHPTYFAMRDASARAAGYRSLWHRRCAEWPASTVRRRYEPIDWAAVVAEVLAA